MREKHGIADAARIAACRGDLQSVVVTDGDGEEIILSLGANSYPAGLTPDQATFIAKQLIAAVRRKKASAIVP